MNDSRQRRRDRRRARAEAQHQAAQRQMLTPGMKLYHMEVDAGHALMERGPLARRLGVVIAGIVAVAALVVWLLGLL